MDWTPYEANEDPLVVKKQIMVYGPLLFFKENHNRYPILSELAKAIFSTIPSSTPVESIFSGAKETANPLRSRAGPEQVRNLTMLRLNKF